MNRGPRLIFGRVAELYDQHRPAYPEPLVDDLIADAGLDSETGALEVGSGTGKATALFASRGIPVLGTEPSAEMAQIGLRNLAGYENVEIEQTDFELWDPAGKRFALIFSAQAWHWVDPSVGYIRARAAARPGGLLAAFWNRPDWPRASLREALLAAYEQASPGYSGEDPMHPADLAPLGEDDWEGAIASADGWGHAEIRRYPWSQDYSSAEYTGLLETTSGVQLLEASERRALLAAVASVIDERGGIFALPMVTRVCVARAE